MNILFFTHHLVQGGAEKTIRTLSQYINAHDMQIEAYICVVYDDPEVHKQMKNVIVMQHKSQAGDSRLSKAFVVWKQIDEMRQIKRKYEIDVCISFLPGADIINVSSGTGEKQIVSVRNRESYFVHNILKKWYVQYSYGRCDYITAVSDAVRQDVISYFGVTPDKICTIHNAVAKNEENDVCTEDFLEFVKGRRIIFNVGRLSIEKGQHFLIRAYARICEQYPDTCLVIIGEGEKRNELQQLINNLKMQDKVFLAGRKSNPYIYLKRGSLFVLSSTIEGMPNVLLEAMQAGLPVISTECGAREILAPKTDTMYQTKVIERAQYGILIPACSDCLQAAGSLTEDILSDEEEILADSMQLMLGNAELCDLYKAENEKCLMEYAVDVIVDEWVDVIRNKG